MKACSIATLSLQLSVDALLPRQMLQEYLSVHHFVNSLHSPIIGVSHNTRLIIEVIIQRFQGFRWLILMPKFAIIFKSVVVKISHLYLREVRVDTVCYIAFHLEDIRYEQNVIDD